MRFRSQRLFYRGLFLLWCVIPTLAIGVWGLARVRPGHVQQYADRLARRSGLRVELDQRARPRPGACRLEGLRLMDPESGRGIASLDRVDVVRGNGRMLITVKGATVQRDQLRVLWELFHNRVLRQMDDIPSTVHVVCSQLALHGPPERDRAETGEGPSGAHHGGPPSDVAVPAVRFAGRYPRHANTEPARRPARSLASDWMRVKVPCPARCSTRFQTSFNRWAVKRSSKVACGHNDRTRVGREI